MQEKLLNTAPSSLGSTAQRRPYFMIPSTRSPGQDRSPPLSLPSRPVGHHPPRTVSQHRQARSALVTRSRHTVTGLSVGRRERRG